MEEPRTEATSVATHWAREMLCPIDERVLQCGLRTVGTDEPIGYCDRHDGIVRVVSTAVEQGLKVRGLDVVELINTTNGVTYYCS